MEVSTQGKQQQQLLHIVAVPCPAQSHISALMHLCKRLSSDPEVLITFVNIDSIHEQMQKHSTRPGPDNIRLEQMEFEWKMPNGMDASCLANTGLLVDSLEKQLPKELSNLINRLNSEVHHPLVACIVSDYFCAWTQQVADEFRIPRAAVCTGSASLACIEYHIPELFARKHIFSKDPEDCVLDYIGGLPPIPRSCIPHYLCGHEDLLWRDQGLKRSYTLKQAAWLVVNSLPALGKQAFEFLRETLGSEKLLPVGSLFLLSGPSSNQKGSMRSHEAAAAENVLLRAEDHECLTWLDSQKPSSVLYISFGSIAVFSKAQLEELVKALQSTRTPFLWVVRPEAGMSDDAYEEFRSGFGDQGLIVAWAPQLRVLCHSSVGGFLTHCGWNSMLESMSFGVPMIGWPWGGEQNTNCRFMADEWKLGVALSCGSGSEGLVIGSEEIGRTIELVMGSDEGAELRSRVKMMSTQCLESAKVADHQLASFLSSLKAGTSERSPETTVPGSTRTSTGST